MSVKDRLKIIKQIEKDRGNRILLTYVTNTRPGYSSMMASDCIRYFYEHLNKIKTKPRNTKIDLFIHSNGGDSTVPWRLVNLIREYCDSFEVLVPYRAYSAATLTAIGADKIFMHPMGELGPIDPSVENDFNPDRPNPSRPGEKLAINVEDVSAYIALLKEDIGITHEDELIQGVKILAEKIHPLALGNVKRLHSQSELIAKKLLRKHMGSSDELKINEIVDNLKSKLYFHGHPINRVEAKEDLKLKVEFPDTKLETLMWQLYLEYEKEMYLTTPFNPAMLMNEAEMPLKEKLQKEKHVLNLLQQELEKQRAIKNQKQIDSIGKKMQKSQQNIQQLMSQLQQMQININNLKAAYIESRFISHTFNAEWKLFRPQPNQIGFEIIKQGWEIEK